MVVLELPSRSESLHFRAYSEPIGEGSFLDWAVARLHQVSRDTPGVYIWIERVEAERVGRALGECSRGILWPTSGSKSLEDLASLARAAGRRVLVLDLSAALLPIDVLRRFVRRHVESRHQASILVQVPSIASPTLMEPELLKRLAHRVSDSPPYSLMRESRLALIGIERVIQEASRRAPLVFGRCGTLSMEEQVGRQWPPRFLLDNPESVEVLKRVLGPAGPDAGNPKTPVEPLDHWTRVAGEQREARLADLRPCLSTDGAKREVVRRVLYVQSPSAFTGVEQVLLLLAMGVRSELVEPFEPVALIAMDGILTDRLAEAAVDVHIARRDFAQSSVEHFLYSRRVLDAVRPGVVHAHTVAGVPFGCAVAERELPFVQHVHVADERAVTVLADQMAVAYAVIAVSEFVKQRLIRLGTDPEKIHVIRNGIQVAPLMSAVREAERMAVRTRIRQAWGIGEATRVVLVVARFAANKRHDVALEAFAQLRARLPGTQFVLAGEAFAGDQPVFEAIERQIERLRIREQVRRVGFWRDMAALYAAADVLLLPSEDDPLPLTVLEAMAAGVPVVAGRSGGIPEMIEAEQSGLLVEPGDAEGFAAALARALTDMELRQNLTERAAARCKVEFSLSRFVTRIARLYELLLAREPVAAGDV